MAKRMHAHKSKKIPARPKKERGAIPGKVENIAASAEEIQSFANKIGVFLRKANGRPVSRADLAAKCRGRGKAGFLRALRKLAAEGLIAERRSGFVWAESAGMHRGTVTRVNRTFGFVLPENGGAEVFVSGRDLKGAVPGDTVLFQQTGMRDGLPEGAVIQVVAAAETRVSGTLVDDEGELRFLPDTLCRRTLFIENAAEWRGHAGDKVLAFVTERGDRHSRHIVRVDVSLGSAESARNCCEALALVSGAPMKFPEEVLAEAAHIESMGITDIDLAGRLDLRESPDIIFTIDGFDAKDLDDAISISRTNSGYALGVHIADVSHYVTLGSELDKEAIRRGTSVYYADQVIPMLPKALSNGICSLHPDVDRLTFSCLMKLGENGELQSWEFRKTVIRSAVKGVYREVNAIFDGTASPEIAEKYAAVRDELLLLDELREKRLAARKKRGAPSLETEESLFILDENGVCTDIAPRTRGKGEELIEECMLLANEAAARTGKEAKLPFVYRVHAAPPDEKSSRLEQALTRLNLPHPNLDKPRPADYAKILTDNADSPLKNAVHQMVLRSMSKADYETDPIGHFGLALSDYAHFTSPIRRYPDLAIHRILSAWLKHDKTSVPRHFAQEAADAGTRTEQRAVQLERDCDDRYRAEWAKQHIGEEFDGVVSGLTEFGVYVMLPNTAEGLIGLDDLPADAYAYDGMFSLAGEMTGRTFTLGMPLRVKMLRADVGSGHIDLGFVSEVTP